ncbi:MAG: hypothetical protein H0V73_10330 [Chloroflexi bacterium]|nr:hypothetical protein [Chloroflexota bacterium]
MPNVDETVSERYNPLLPNGTRLFVVDGPALGSGYDWYRVIVPGVTRAGGEPLIGWIAVADSKTGEVWAQNAPLACPPAGTPVPVADLVRLAGDVPDGRVSCFGSVPFTATASIQIGCADPSPSATQVAGWLAAPARMTMRLTDEGSTVEARVHPDLAGRTACDPQPGGRWSVTGHFDDPDAASCGLAAGTPAAAELAIYRCRSIYVVTELTRARPLRSSQPSDAQPSAPLS